MRPRNAKQRCSLRGRELRIPSKNAHLATVGCVEKDLADLLEDRFGKAHVDARKSNGNSLFYWTFRKNSVELRKGLSKP